MPQTDRHSGPSRFDAWADPRSVRPSETATGKPREGWTRPLPNATVKPDATGPTFLPQGGRQRNLSRPPPRAKQPQANVGGPAARSSLRPGRRRRRHRRIADTERHRDPRRFRRRRASEAVPRHGQPARTRTRPRWLVSVPARLRLPHRRRRLRTRSLLRTVDLGHGTPRLHFAEHIRRRPARQALHKVCGLHHTGLLRQNPFSRLYLRQAQLRPG